MKSIAQNKRYLQHEVTTKLYAVRLYRQGQEHGVIVHHIVCGGTVDSRVLAALRNKDATQRSLLDALKGYIKEEL